MMNMNLDQKKDEINPETIGIAVDRLILGVLSQKNQKLYSRTTPLIDMQLEAKEMSELQDSLNRQFLVDLHPTFFFQHSTSESIIQYLIETKLKVFRDRLYEIEWKDSEIPEIQTLPFDRTWLLFAEESDTLLPHIRKLLTEELQNCITIHPGKEFKRLGNDTFIVNPNSSVDLKSCFVDFTNINKIYGVIYLSANPSFISNKEKELSFESLESYHEKVSCGLISLVRGLDLLHLSQAPKFYFVTQSYILDGTVDSLAQWPLSALCRVIVEEYPQLDCHMIALDPQANEIESGDTLYAEISCKSTEPQVAWKNGKRHVSRLVRTGTKEVYIPSFSSDATYIIAGGHRPLGLLIAWWYISHGAKHLILLDEIEENPSIQATLKELRSSNVKIDAFVVNFDDVSALNNIFAKIKKECPPIKGVIHTAGVVDNELIKDINWERFKPTHRLKIGGSWNLHRLTEGMDLDHFILFSSCVSFLAPLGKASHATGNAFLDVLSHYRRKKGLPSLTIDWGPWNPRNAVIKKLVDNTLTNRMELLSVEEGFKALENIFYFNKPQVVDVMIKWTALLSHLNRDNPFFDEIAKELGIKRNPLLLKYSQTPNRERYNIIQSFVHEHVRRLMMLHADEVLDIEQDFSAMGIDKIELANLKNRIQFDIEDRLTLPANFLTDNSTIAKLSRALLNALNESQISKVRKTSIYQ